MALRYNGNLSTGGTASNCTGRVHPHNARIAVKAAKLLKLDIAGIDITCSDISKPLDSQNGAVIEVNSAPGLRMHIHPTEGEPVDVAGDIMDFLYPPGKPTSVPDHIGNAQTENDCHEDDCAHIGFKRHGCRNDFNQRHIYRRRMHTERR